MTTNTTTTRLTKEAVAAANAMPYHAVVTTTSPAVRVDAEDTGTLGGLENFSRALEERGTAAIFERVMFEKAKGDRRIGCLEEKVAVLTSDNADLEDDVEKLRKRVKAAEAELAEARATLADWRECPDRLIAMVAKEHGWTLHPQAASGRFFKTQDPSGNRFASAVELIKVPRVPPRASAAASSLRAAAAATSSSVGR